MMSRLAAPPLSFITFSIASTFVIVISFCLPPIRLDAMLLRHQTHFCFLCTIILFRQVPFAGYGSYPLLRDKNPLTLCLCH